MSDLNTLRTAYAEKRYEDAVMAYRSMTDLSPAVHFYGGLAFRAAGRLIEARWALEAGLANSPGAKLRLQLMLVYGFTLRELGDTRHAIETLERVVDDMQGEPELARVTLGAGYYNLGLTYRQARRMQDAITAYHMAVAEFRRESMPTYLVQALQNLAWTYCVVGDDLGAGRALDESEGLCRTSEDQCHQRLGRAYAALVSGEYHLSAQFCVNVIGAYSVPVDAMSYAYWLLARGAVAQNRIPEAEAMAETALRYAEEARGTDSRCLLDVADLFREISSKRRRDTNAETDGDPAGGDHPGDSRFGAG